MKHPSPQLTIHSLNCKGDELRVAQETSGGKVSGVEWASLLAVSQALSLLVQSLCSLGPLSIPPSMQF